MPRVLRRASQRQICTSFLETTGQRQILGLFAAFWQTPRNKESGKQHSLSGYDGARNEEAESRSVQTILWRSRLYLSPERQDLTEDKPTKYRMKHDVYSLGVVLLEIALWEDFANERNAYGRLFQKSRDLPKVLMQLTKRIPILMGNKYRDVVVSSLQEVEQERTSQLLNDGNGIVVGMAYIEQFTSKLEKISL